MLCCHTLLALRLAGLRHRLVYASEWDPALHDRIKKIHNPDCLVDDMLKHDIGSWPSRRQQLHHGIQL